MAQPIKNLPFKFKQIKFNFEVGRGGAKIEFIIFHDTGNKGRNADAQAHFNYFNGKYVGASAHYFVDDHQIIQIIGDQHTAWAVGDNQGYGRALNGAKNRNSISVELCVNSNGNYEVAYANAIELIKALQKKFRLPDSKVQRHYDVSRKNCPGTMRPNDWAKYRKLKAALQQKPLLQLDLSKDSTAKWIGGDYQEPAAPAPVGPSANTFYTLGAKGPAVKELQEKLSILGYTIDIDGSFGPGMDKAVRLFQKQNGLGVDGSTGPATQAKIQELLGRKDIPKYYRRGTTGGAVREVQQQLKDLGYTLEVDGSFGPGLELTIKQFQKQHNLEQDGSAGPDTRIAIREALAAKVEAEKPKPEPTPEPTPEPEPEEKPEEGKDFIIQAGKFHNYENAKEYSKELKDKGIDNFVKEEK